MDFIKRYEGLWLFTRSPAAIIAAIVACVSILGAAFAPLIASVNPYDLASFSLMDGLLPPVWEEYGNPKFLLGTDDQGRDMVSSILYGARLSLIIGSQKEFRISVFFPYRRQQTVHQAEGRKVIGINGRNKRRKGCT